VVAVPGEADAAVAEATGGHGTDLAVECVGTQETLAQAMRLVGAGGTVLVFGTTAPAADGLPTYQWYFKELTILNPRAARPRDCDAAIRLAASRRLELAPLVTARFPLAQAGAALAACAAPGQLKVMLDVTTRDHTEPARPGTKGAERASWPISSPAARTPWSSACGCSPTAGIGGARARSSCRGSSRYGRRWRRAPPSRP
jgi:hypothetical protein